VKKALLFIVLVPLVGYGQKFHYSATLDSVEQTGFHRIPLNAEIAGGSQLDWRDLRILDGDGDQVPYLLQTSDRKIEDEVFKQFDIVRQDYEGHRTTIVIHNPNQKMLDNINLFITNADARKVATVSGSYDRQQWFVVRDHFHLQGGRSWHDVQEVRLLDLPLINYTYIKLVIYDCFVDPLQIVKVGTYDYLQIEGSYDPIPAPSIVQLADTLHSNTSLYKIEFDQRYPIDRIQFVLQGAPYFQRQAELFYLIERQASKKQWKRGEPKRYTSEEYVRSFQLSSASMNVLDHRIQSSSVYYLRIHNEDNPALELQTLRAQMLKTSVVAHLRADDSYRLVFGNEKLKRPVYDIDYFTSNIPRNIPELTVGTIQADAHVNDQTPLAKINLKTILWIVMSAVGLMVLVFSVRLLRDLKSGETGP
jgi:hypothetical protein